MHPVILFAQELFDELKLMLSSSCLICVFATVETQL